MLFVIYVVFQMQHFLIKTSGKRDVIHVATFKRYENFNINRFLVITLQTFSEM